MGRSAVWKSFGLTGEILPRRKMDKDIADLKKRLHLGGMVILAAGLCCAILIYLTAADVSNSADSYVIVNGVAYPTDLTHSKAYVHELERFGGKAAVLFDEIYRWFVGLWQGKSLAISVAWITALVSLGMFVFAANLPSESESAGRIDGSSDTPV